MEKIIRDAVPARSFLILGLSLLCVVAFGGLAVATYLGDGGMPSRSQAARAHRDSTATEVAAITSLCAMFGTVVTGWFAYIGKRNAEQANDAVNHRHRTGSPRLYDQVLTLGERLGEIRASLRSVEAWKNDYMGGPLDTGPKVVEFVRTMHTNLNDVHDRLKRIESACTDLCNRPHG